MTALRPLLAGLGLLGCALALPMVVAVAWDWATRREEWPCWT